MSGSPNNCRVGILIPCFNGADTIAETLESIQRQAALGELTGVYLADNASTDGTVNIVRDVWKSSPAITVLPNRQNVGQAANVNRAFRELSSQLDWILVVHADDVVKPHWLPVMLERIRNCSDRVASISSSWDDLYADGTIKPGQEEPAITPVLNRGTRAEVRRTLLAGCWWHISGCAIRVRAFLDVGDFSLQLVQQFDTEWLLRCLQRGWDIEYVPRALVVYRNHAANITSASFKENRDIRDSLEIAARNRQALSPGDWLRIHGRLFTFCIRRTMRASTRADFDRIARCSRTAATVVASCVRHAMNPLMTGSQNSKVTGAA